MRFQFLRIFLLYGRTLGSLYRDLRASGYMTWVSLFCNLYVMHPVVCVYNSVKWGRLHYSDVYRMEAKIDTNVSTFVYYAQMLTYLYLFLSPFCSYHCCVDDPINATVL
jgi:hypothetical protein